MNICGDDGINKDKQEIVPKTIKVRADRLKKGDIVLIGGSDLIKETVINIQIGRYYKHKTSVFFRTQSNNIVEREFRNDRELDVLI